MDEKQLQKLLGRLQSKIGELSLQNSFLELAVEELEAELKSAGEDTSGKETDPEGTVTGTLVED